MKAGKEAGDWNRKEVAANDEKLLAEMTAKGAVVARPDLKAGAPPRRERSRRPRRNTAPMR